jgi:hypothetical protein
MVNGLSAAVLLLHLSGKRVNQDSVPLAMMDPITYNHSRRTNCPAGCLESLRALVAYCTTRVRLELRVTVFDPEVKVPDTTRV